MMVASRAAVACFLLVAEADQLSSAEHLRQRPNSEAGAALQGVTRGLEAGRGHGPAAR